MTAPQEKDWAVMTATEQVIVDDKRQAQVAFTVTNLQRMAASVTVTVVADDVAASWFTVDRPVRYVDSGGSTQYEVRAAVPQDAPSADYSFQLLAYSSDTAPEERPTYSSRVLLRVPAKPVRRRRLKLILLLAGIVLAVAALVTTLVVVLAEEDGPEAVPSATPSAETVRVPNVQGETDIEVIKAKFAEVGLIADIKYMQRNGALGAFFADPMFLREAAPGSVVVVHVAVFLTRPDDVRVTVELPGETLPAYGPVSLRVVANVELSWQQQETYVQSWLVQFVTCALGNGWYVWRKTADFMYTNTTRLRVVRHFTPQTTEVQYTQTYSCPLERELVYIYPLDDFGQAGPSSLAAIDADLSGYSNGEMPQ